MKLYKSVIPSLLFLSFLLTGCLKDKDYDNGSLQSVRSGGIQKIVEISLTTTATTNFLLVAMDSKSTDTTFNLIPVTVNSADGATEDVNVTLVANPALIGSYNADHGASYEAAPASVFTILNTPSSDGTGFIVTIPKGSNTGYLQVKLKTSDYLGHQYAFGYQISKVDKPGYLISSNLSSGIFSVGVKNAWDGVYSYRGFSFRAGDASLTGNFSGKEMPLVTSASTAVVFGSIPLWGDGNSGIAIGNPNLSLNTSGSSPFPLTITSPGGAINGPNGPGSGTPYSSRYDASSRTFYISFTWGAGPAARLSIDTLTYLRPR